MVRTGDGYDRGYGRLIKITGDGLLVTTGDGLLVRTGNSLMSLMQDGQQKACQDLYLQAVCILAGHHTHLEILAVPDRGVQLCLAIAALYGPTGLHTQLVM